MNGCIVQNKEFLTTKNETLWFRFRDGMNISRIL